MKSSNDAFEPSPGNRWWIWQRPHLDAGPAIRERRGRSRKLARISLTASKLSFVGRNHKFCNRSLGTRVRRGDPNPNWVLSFGLDLLALSLRKNEKTWKSQENFSIRLQWICFGEFVSILTKESMTFTGVKRREEWAQPRRFHPRDD